MSLLRIIFALGLVVPLLSQVEETTGQGGHFGRHEAPMPSSPFEDDGAIHARLAATSMGDDVSRVPAGGVSADCTAKGKRLYGRVKVVDAFADLTVRKVDAFADLRVKRVDAFADECGEWMFVDAFPDFTIRYVDAFADVTIKEVDAFPGLP